MGRTAASCGLPGSLVTPQNQKLLLENQLLRERTGNLTLENRELRSRLGLDALKMEENESKVSFPLLLSLSWAQPGRNYLSVGEMRGSGRG